MEMNMACFHSYLFGIISNTYKDLENKKKKEGSWVLEHYMQVMKAIFWQRHQSTFDGSISREHYFLWLKWEIWSSAKSEISSLSDFFFFTFWLGQDWLNFWTMNRVTFIARTPCHLWSGAEWSRSWVSSLWKQYQTIYMILHRNSIGIVSGPATIMHVLKSSQKEQLYIMLECKRAELSWTGLGSSWAWLDHKLGEPSQAKLDRVKSSLVSILIFDYKLSWAQLGLTTGLSQPNVICYEIYPS